MLDSQNDEREEIESAKDEPDKDESVRPVDSYYYDDATGYDVYQDEDDDIAEPQTENCKLS